MKKNIKFIYSTDHHIWERNPKSRVDNYFDAILTKYGNIRECGREEQVDFYLEGGDLYHRPLQSPLEINRTMEMFLKDVRVPTYAIIGNHPIKSNYETWFPRSGIKALSLALGHDRVAEQYDELFVPLTLVHPTVCNLSVKQCLEHSSKLGGDHVIRLHHTQLVKKPVIWDHTLWEDYDPEGATIVLVSDYHGFQGHEVINGVHFIAPGAVCRNTMGPDDMTRKPQFALVEISAKTGAVHVDFIELPHEPAEKIFNVHGTLDPVEVTRDNTHLQDCLEKMQEMSESDVVMDPEGMLRFVAKGLDVSEEAVEYSIEILHKSEEKA